MEHVIIDGDWGGDEMQLAAVLLTQPRRANILGATSVFGNASVEHCHRNARNVLALLGRPDIAVYQGASAATSAVKEAEKDGAYGDDGAGGAKLPESTAPATKKSAVDFILETLKNQPEKSVTITVSGPLTNIAQAFASEPDTMRRVKKIIIMGGCTEDIPACDKATRKGNITPYAEFNFYQAPADANTVLQSGLPITLIPMNCSQQLAWDDGLRERVKDKLSGHPQQDAVMQMLSCADFLDELKFGSKQFMHDANCALYAMHPDAYRSSQRAIRVVTEGEKIGMCEVAEEGKRIQVAERITHPTALKLLVSESLSRQLNAALKTR